MFLFLLIHTLSSYSAAHSVQVHGHRGARAVRPENTIPAFEYALANGVDVLELDLGVTKDNKLVIIHDQTLNPEICLDPNGKKITRITPVNSLTLSELKSYDCGALKNPKFEKQKPEPGTRVPSFDQFAQWLETHPNPRAKTIKLNVEMKSEESQPELSPDPATFAKLLISSLKRFKLMNRTIIQSFDFRTLAEARKLAPKAVISLLVENRPNESLVELAKKYNAEIVSPNQDWLTREDVAPARAAGVKIVPWTANAEKEWQKLLDMGVDGIISDDPFELIKYLERKPLKP